MEITDLLHSHPQWVTLGHPYSSPCLTATVVNDHARGHKRNRDWIVIGYETAVFNHHSDRDWSFITGEVEVS